VGEQVHNFGYTAAVWRRSSLATFRPIGEGRYLRVSPPDSQANLDTRKLMSAPLNYYNLHGMQDVAEWYGQREPQSKTPGPDYPVALSPKDLHKNGHTPQIVFSEACYGGFILNKNEDQSLALRFIDLGTQAVVCSTGIAYGSVNTPLIGADLLGQCFWRYVREGYGAGQALMQAKVDLVREMNRRQSYLDGEDQKTLISFVLYGDPLVVRTKAFKQAKEVVRPKEHPSVRTICDQMEDEQVPQRINSEVMKQVKQVVEGYLPGLEDAEIHINRQQESMDAHSQAPAVLGMGGKKAIGTERVVVTFSKQMQVSQKTHYQYARVTLDQEGTMVKLAISR
jgi:hypothetical protein